MTPDVTIHVSFGNGGTSVSAESGQITTAQDMLSAGAPSPLPLEQLQVASAGEAPAPASPDELSRVEVATITGEPPPPMAVEQLVSTTVAAAPAPQPFGMLESVGGPPAPLSVEELEELLPDEAPRSGRRRNKND